MNDKKIWKKVTSLVLIASIILMSVSVPNMAYATDTMYDFSDAAQAEFDAQEYVIIKNTPDGLSIETTQKEKKKRQSKKNDTEQVSSVEENLNNNNIPVQDTTVFDAVQDMEYQDAVIKQQASMLKGQVVYIDAGATFVAILQSSISSASLAKGDTIAAVLQDDWFYNGILIAPQGSIIYGKTIDAAKARGGYGSGRLAIKFDEMLTPNGDQLLLTSNVVEVVVDDKRWWKVAGNVLVGAAAGALLSLMFVSGDDRDKSTGAIIGAGLGGVAGGIRAANQKGEEIEIPAGTAIQVRLTQPMNAAPYEDVL